MEGTSNKIWLHRISHHMEVAKPLLENNGCLTIGFSYFSSSAYPDFVHKTLDGDTGGRYFDEIIESEWGKYRPRWSLWHFIVDMKKGDQVLIPIWDTFSLYEIIDNSPKRLSDLGEDVKDWSGKSFTKKDDGLFYYNNESLDLGFYRSVKPIAIGISRSDYADSALTQRMKIRQTNADITNIRESVENAMVRFINQKPINAYLLIMNETIPLVLKILKEFLIPDKFEKIVKYYFERIGATSVDIPAKNERDKEGDADVVAIFEPIKTIIYCQVKFHDGETSRDAIDQIKDYVDYRERNDDEYSKIGWVISSADYFSPDAIQKSKEGKVQLFDGRTFAKMLLEAGVVNLNHVL